jgi:hypothetical protein
MILQIIFIEKINPMFCVSKIAILSCCNLNLAAVIVKSEKMAFYTNPVLPFCPMCNKMAHCLN